MVFAIDALKSLQKQQLGGMAAGQQPRGGHVVVWGAAWAQGGGCMNGTLPGVQLRGCLTAPFLLPRHAPRAGGCLLAALTPPASRCGRMSWPEMLVSPPTPHRSHCRACPCCSRVGQHHCGSRDNPHPLVVIHGEGNWPNIRYFSPSGALQPCMEPPPFSTAPIPAPSCLSQPFPPIAPVTLSSPGLCTQ